MAKMAISNKINVMINVCAEVATSQPCTTVMVLSCKSKPCGSKGLSDAVDGKENPKII